MATPNSQINPTRSRSRMIMEEIVNSVQMTPISQQTAARLPSGGEPPRNRDDSSPLPYASSTSNDSSEISSSSLGLMPRSSPPTLTFASAAGLKVAVPHDDVLMTGPSIKVDTQQPQNKDRQEEHPQQQQQQQAPSVEQSNQKETAASSQQQQLQQTQASSATQSTQITREPEKRIIQPKLFFRPPPPVAPQAFKFAPRKLNQLKPPQTPTPSAQLASAPPAPPTAEKTSQEASGMASSSEKTNLNTGAAMPSSKFPVRGAQPMSLSAVKSLAASSNSGIPTTNGNGPTVLSEASKMQPQLEKSTEVAPIQTSSLLPVKEEPNEQPLLNVSSVRVREVYAKVPGAGAQPQLVLEISDDDDNDKDMEEPSNPMGQLIPGKNTAMERTETTQWNREMELDQQSVSNNDVLPFVPDNTMPLQTKSQQQLNLHEKSQEQTSGDHRDNTPNNQPISRNSPQITLPRGLAITEVVTGSGHDDTATRQLIRENVQANGLQFNPLVQRALTEDLIHNSPDETVQHTPSNVSADPIVSTSRDQPTLSGEHGLFNSLILSLCKDGQYDLVPVISNFAQKEKSYKVEIEQSNSLIKAYEQRLKQVETVKATHKTTVEELNKELSALKNDAQVMLTEMTTYESKIDSLNDDCKNLRKHCDDLRERLKNESTKGHSESIQLAEMRDQLSNLCHLVETQASTIASEYEPYRKLAEGSLGGKKDLDQKLIKNAQTLDKISLKLQEIQAVVKEEGESRTFFQEELINITKLQTVVESLEKQLEEKSALVLQERAERQLLISKPDEITPLLEMISKSIESLKEPQDGAQMSLKELLIQQQVLKSTLDEQYPNLLEQINSLRVDSPLTVSHVAALEKSFKDSQDNIYNVISRLNALSLKEESLLKVQDLLRSEIEKLSTINKQGYESIQHSLGQSIATLQSNVLNGDTIIKSLQDELSKSTQELKDKSAQVLSLENNLQSSKLEIEHKDKLLEERQLQVSRLQDLKEELATTKGELSATKERALDAEKRAEEANKKASECNANHLSLQQTKILMENLESRHENLRKEKEALEEKNRKDEEGKQARHEAEVEFTRKQLKEAHADELQCLKRRIEDLESQLEASKVEVQKANDFNKSANDRLAEIMNKHSDEMIKWENEKAELLAKIRAPVNHRYGPMGRYPAAQPQEQSIKRPDVYSPFKIPSSTTRRALFHAASPVPQLATNVLLTIHDDSPLFAKSQQAIQRQSISSHSSTRESVSDPITPINTVEKAVNESAGQSSRFSDSMVSRDSIVNLEQQQSLGSESVPSFMEKLTVTEEIRLARVEVPTRAIKSEVGKENLKVNVSLDDDNDILVDSDESNSTIDGEHELEQGHEITKDSETPEKIRGVKRPIAFVDSEVRSSSPLPPKRCKAVPKPKGQEEDEEISDFTESSQPQGNEGFEQPKIQGKATRRSSRLSHRSSMTPIAEATNSSSDDDTASNPRPKTAHGKSGRLSDTAHNSKLRSTSGAPNKRHRRTYSQ